FWTAPDASGAPARTSIIPIANERIDQAPVPVPARFKENERRVKRRSSRNGRLTQEQLGGDERSRIEDRGSRIEDRGSRIEAACGGLFLRDLLSSILDPRLFTPRAAAWPAR